MTWSCRKKCMNPAWREGLGARGVPNYVTRPDWVWCGNCELAIHRIYAGTGQQPHCPCCCRPVRVKAKRAASPSRKPLVVAA